MFSKVHKFRHVKPYSDSVFDNPNYARPVSSLSSTTTITWKCPDCHGNHKTAENRKYYCTILSRQV